MVSLARLRPDGFLLAILAAVGIATALPARGVAVPYLNALVAVSIFALFFMYGGRLESREALAALRHRRLHFTILAFTYVVFPLVGLALAPLSGRVLSETLYQGVLYTCLVPSTVQSSIAFTSIARGNVPGAIVSASLSNLLGVALTPLLVLVLMTQAGDVSVDASAVVKIVLQILLPFWLGQLSRKWTANWLAANRGWLRLTDRGVIVLVVYSAFSAGMREGIWTIVGWQDILAVIVVCVALLALLLWLTKRVATRMGFAREDVIVVQFCGTKKSLASGLPMALVLFADQPVGLIILPLMVFHQVQLMVCAVLAQRYADEAPAQRPA